MTELNKPEQVKDQVVVTMQYELTVDNEVVDSSEDDEAIEFIQGMGQIIPGLERELYGLKIGDRKSVHVIPEDGYGEMDPDAIQEIPREEFPDDIPLEIGVELELKDQDGESLFATILSVNKKTVKLDFNEPLAGKDLHFEIEIVDLRHATPEELEHGHVHGDH
jgi:FKBP-type peptidyl-prolyl cis-trans isomerase SlyD